MFVPAAGPSTDSYDARVAWLRGTLTFALSQFRTDEAIGYLYELHRLGAARLLEAAEVVRALHRGPRPDPRAERWLVRLIARIAIEHELDLGAFDELFEFAERYATDHEARDAIDRFCVPPMMPSATPQNGRTVP